MSFREPIRKKNFSPLSRASASNPLQRRRFKVPKPPKQVVRRSPEEQKAFLQQKLEQSAFVGYNGLNVPVKAPEPPPPPPVQKQSASGALENNSQQPEIPEVETTSEQEEQTAQPKEKLSSEASSNPESPNPEKETEGVTPDEPSEVGTRKHQSQIPDLQAQKQRASRLSCNWLEIPVNAPGTEAGKQLPAKSITPLVQRSASGTSQASPEQEPKKPENTSEDTASARELLHNARDNWNEAKRRYVPRGKMSPLLKLRTEVVGKIITDIQKDIHQETQTPVDAEITSNNQSVAKLPAEPQPALKPIAPGSGDPTSDYDVTFSAGRGDKKAEIKAVERFNALFRGQWKKESGTVFDTNVYTTGHMPKASSNTPTTDAFGATNKEIEDLKNKQKKGTITEEEKLRLPSLLQEQNHLKEQLGTEIDEEKENKWINPASRDKFNRDQDIMSLVKIRRFMSPREWNRYKKDMLKPYQRVPGQETLSQETERRLTAAENFYNDRESDLQVKLAEVRAAKKLPSPDAQKGKTDGRQLSSKKRKEAEDNAVLEASNKLYVQCLEKVEEVLRQIDEVEQRKKENHNETENDKLDKLIYEFHLHHSRGLYYANEAYHTGGAAEHVVLNQQMKLELKLTLEQYLQSVNEQTGFVMEQIKHHPYLGRCLWTSAKYIERIGLAVQEIEGELEELGVSSIDRKGKPDLMDMASRLVKEVKKNNKPEGDEYETINKQKVKNKADMKLFKNKKDMALEIAEQYGIKTIPDLKKEVREWNLQINHKIRSVLANKYSKSPPATSQPEL